MGPGWKNRTGSRLDIVLVVIASFGVIALPVESEVTGEIRGKILWGFLSLARVPSAASAMEHFVTKCCTSLSLCVCFYFCSSIRLSLTCTQVFLGLNSKKAITALYKRKLYSFSLMGKPTGHYAILQVGI